MKIKRRCRLPGWSAATPFSVCNAINIYIEKIGMSPNEKEDFSPYIKNKKQDREVKE